jgi:hypothetical protein
VNVEVKEARQFVNFGLGVVSTGRDEIVDPEDGDSASVVADCKVISARRKRLTEDGRVGWQAPDLAAVNYRCNRRTHYNLSFNRFFQFICYSLQAFSPNV